MWQERGKESWHIYTLYPSWDFFLQLAPMSTTFTAFKGPRVLQSVLELSVCACWSSPLLLLASRPAAAVAAVVAVAAVAAVVAAESEAGDATAPAASCSTPVTGDRHRKRGGREGREDGEIWGMWITTHFVSTSTVPQSTDSKMPRHSQPLWMGVSWNAVAFYSSQGRPQCIVVVLCSSLTKRTAGKHRPDKEGCWGIL